MATSLPLEGLTKYRFRLSPLYVLIPLNKVSDKIEQSNEVDGESLFGVVKDKESGAYRLIDCDTALLLYTLQEPDHLPYHVTRALDTSMLQDIQFMLSINILELEVKDGEYLSGGEALSWLKKEPLLPLRDINMEAVLYANSLLPTDHKSLASALYTFNHKPVSKARQELLMDRGLVKKFFRLDTPSKERQAFDSFWEMQDGNRGWIAFFSKRVFNRGENLSKQSYKLYLSPSELDRFQAIFFSVATLLYRAGAFQFKIGNDAYGLYRPDKWVAYFHDKASLYRAIELIEQEIGEIPAQEVPFSAVTNLKWLGWGSDPEEQKEERISWRWYLCSEMAHALLDMKDDESFQKEEIWNHVAVRLEREGIDPITFELIE